MSAVPSRRDGFERTGWLWAVTAVVLVFLLLPVAVVLLYSFNSESSLIVFGQASLRWYEKLFHDPSMIGSLITSAEIAAIAAVVSLVLGTLLAIGLARGDGRVAAGTGGMVFLRLVTPETATAASLFLLFTQLKVPLGFWTIVIGHVALCTAFATVVVRSRVSAINREIEDAAQDLGAPRLLAIWLVVLPPLRPTLVSAGLLSFVLSFDDFITTYFTSGTGDQPLPLRIYSMLRFGVTPEVNAAGVLMLLVVAVVLGLAALATLLVKRHRAVPSPVEGP